MERSVEMRAGPARGSTPPPPLPRLLPPFRRERRAGGQRRVRRRLTVLSWTAAVGLWSIGLSSLAAWSRGWGYGSSAALGPLPRPATSVALVLLGTALALGLSGRSRTHAALSTAAGVLVMGLTAETLADYAGGQASLATAAIGRVLNTDSAAFAQAMTLPAAVCALLLAAALVLRQGGRWGHVPAVTLTAAALMISCVGVVVHLYGMATFLLSSGLAGLSLLSACALSLAAVGILAARPSDDAVALLASPRLDGMMVRRVLPATYVVLTLLGFVRVRGEALGLYDTGLGAAALVVSAAAAVTALVLPAAYQVRRSEAGRVQADQQRSVTAAWLQAILDEAPSNFYVKDCDGRYRLVNRQFLATFGLSDKEVVGRTDLELFGERQGAAARTSDRLVLDSGRPSKIEERPEGERDGDDRTFLTVKFPLLDPDGEISGLCGISTDISERIRSEQEREALAVRLRLALDAVDMGTWDWHIPSGRVHWTPAVYRLFGVDPSVEPSFELFGRAVHPDDRDAVQASLDEAVRSFEPWERQFRVNRPDGSVSWLLGRGQVITSEDGTAEWMFGINFDTSRQHAAEDELRHQALHDALTGLPNRTLVLDRLAHAVARLEREPHLRVGVLFIDLDRFKVVNDSLGHEAGDKVLIALGERIRAAVRPADTVARFGGDEFVVVCEDVASDDDVVRLADRIAATLREPVSIGGRDVASSVSIGIALASESGAEPEALLRDADAALYQAKEAGRDRHAVFAETLRKRAERRLETKDELRTALARDELRVLYQPVIDLTDNRMVSVEALVRWQHPRRGLLAPAEFIDVAEETGLIVPLGAWVLSEACRQAAAWSRMPGGDDLQVSVNLSGRQVVQRDLVAVVAQQLHNAGLDADRVVMEITESVVMADAEGSARTIAELKQLGVGISIDDFGTGYSSLAYLRRFAADTLKVDGSFVHGLGEQTEDAALISGIVNLAHTLGLRVVAEGAETAAQVRLLRLLGADAAQGFHFAAPTGADAISVLLGQPAWPEQLEAARS